MSSHPSRDYTEIQTLSVEKNLEPGESLENTVLIHCHRLPAGLDDCELAQHVRRLVGELPVAPPEVPAPGEHSAEGQAPRE
jgi:hypothetical protein